MRKNIFTAALESQSEQPIDVATIIQETQQDFQPKPGFKEDGDEPSAEKVTKAIGDDSAPSVAEHDEIDTVAESQEHVLALEHLQKVSQRYCRMAAALEEIAEVAEQNLEEGQSMDPTQVAMVTTAIDAGGIGEPMADSVALEAFGMDARVATEGFIDAVKDRAEKVWAAVAKFAKKAVEITHQKLKRFADYFRSLPSIYEKLSKEGEILNTNAGKPFQNSKWEKDLQERACAPSSTKTILDTVSGAAADFKEVTALADGKLHGELRSLNSSWATDKPETVVAQMNKVLAVLKQLADTGHGKFKHSAAAVEVNLPERINLEGTSGLEGTSMTWEDTSHEFTAGIKTATYADIAKLKESALHANRAIDSAIDGLFDGKLFEVTYKTRNGYSKDDPKVARQLLSKYTNLMRIAVDISGASLFSVANGYYLNHFNASKWIRYSIAEAKQAARGGK